MCRHTSDLVRKTDSSGTSREVRKVHKSGHRTAALTRDIFWPLIIPQAEQSRVSQLASRRPLGESDLSDELRFHPLSTRTGVTDITSIARTLQSELTTRLLACRGDILS
jgi:hypothetical protein